MGVLAGACIAPPLAGQLPGTLAAVRKEQHKPLAVQLAEMASAQPTSSVSAPAGVSPTSITETSQGASMYCQGTCIWWHHECCLLHQ